MLSKSNARYYRLDLVGTCTKIGLVTLVPNYNYYTKPQRTRNVMQEPNYNKIGCNLIKY